MVFGVEGDKVLLLRMKGFGRGRAPMIEPRAAGSSCLAESAVIVCAKISDLAVPSTSA